MIDIFSLYAKEEVDSSGLFFFMGARGYLAVTFKLTFSIKIQFATINDDFNTNF